VYNKEKAKIMEAYGPQLPQLPQMPQVSQPTQAQGGMSWMPGATTIGVVCADGVILASEKRVTYGNFIMSKGGKKVFKVTDRIGVACAGLVGDMQILAREVEAQANLFSMDVGRNITVRATAKMLANILFNRRYAPLITQTIIGGLDEDGASLYVLDVLGSLIPDKYAVVGSGTETAMGVLEEGYKPEMKIKEAKDLVVRSIKSAISRDAMSGDGLDFLYITKDGITEESIKF
jgi:proteasome beta subunit